MGDSLSVQLSDMLPHKLGHLQAFIQIKKKHNEQYSIYVISGDHKIIYIYI